MLQHEHFGRLRGHRHTSYASLLFLLVLAAVLLVGYSLVVQAASPAVNPQSGSVGLSGRVNGPPPSTAATILSPGNGTTTSTIPITVSGTCPKSTFVEVDKNGVFGGATSCADAGTYSLLVDLFPGKNTLIAKVSDALGQYGPDSSAIVVYYNAPAAATASAGAGQQLFITTQDIVLGGSPNTTIQRNATIVGGVPPYAVSWDFGDGQNSLSSVQTTGPISANHSYTQPGVYNVVLRITDSQGNSAYLQTVTVVNGPVTAVGTTNGNGKAAASGNLLAAWPLLLLAILMVIAFWLGERRQKHKDRQEQLKAMAAMQA
jgi:hypothetical protein